MNFWLEDQATAASLFPILTAEWVNDVSVQDLVLDGNMEQNEEIDGNHAGAVFIQHSDRFTFDNVIARNYNGDGFSWQVCDDVRLERCRSEGNANLGFHPGSGSQRPRLRDCTALGNDEGIFFCWGVTDGVVENCLCAENRAYGISIGHRDTDNRISGCTIERNGKVGILFREPDDEFRGGHRNAIEASLIRDIGVELLGETHDVAIRNCSFEDSGEGRQRIGIRVGGAAQRTRLEGNSFHGMEADIERGAAADRPTDNAGRYRSESRAGNGFSRSSAPAEQPAREDHMMPPGP
jgi:nitrous oxidase accessory protein NosD